jgi:hypothetical protein
MQKQRQLRRFGGMRALRPQTRSGHHPAEENYEKRERR